MDITPEQYEHWYHTPRGEWISAQEFNLLMRLLNPITGARLLDVGCGTGHFSRRFAQAKLKVTGLEPDPAMLDYARQQGGDIAYREGHAEALPFADEQFDYCAAITSLCFVADPVKALREMGRVSKHSIMLGLLNRHSLLHRQKAGRGAYAGARWDSRADVINWLNRAGMGAVYYQVKSAIFFPSGGRLTRMMEKALPGSLLWGGFLAVILSKTAANTYVT